MNRTVTFRAVLYEPVVSLVLMLGSEQVLLDTSSFLYPGFADAVLSAGNKTLFCGKCCICDNDEVKRRRPL